MAEVILRDLVGADDLLAGRVEVTSAGTASWHVGSPMDPRARRALDRAGLRLAGSPAAYADRTYLDSHDVIVVMTREQLHDVRTRLSTTGVPVLLFRNLLEPGTDLDVPDPYYGDDDEFDACQALLSRAAQCLILDLRRDLKPDSREV